MPASPWGIRDLSRSGGQAGRVNGRIQTIGERRGLASIAPIVIGGTGGSGTRVVHAVLAQAGAFMGVRLNLAGDAMDFEPFLDVFINQVLTVTRSVDYAAHALPAPLRQSALSVFDRVAVPYRDERPTGARWGWKNPRSMFVLPLIHARFPAMRFVHVVRDGRDMALSPNRNQLRKHHAALFGEPASENDNLAALRLWCVTNRQVADWGTRTLGARYIRVRFEDLCAFPSSTCSALARRLGLPVVAGDRLASLVVPPPTLGRWRGAEAAALPTRERSVAEVLAAFGYR